MTWFAQLLLVLTGVAPIALVFAAVEAERGQPLLAVGALLVAFFLWALCTLLLRGARRSRAAAPRKLQDAKSRESEPVAFFVAYALPLVAYEPGKSSLWGLAAFATLMALTMWQQRVFHVNPLLALSGYQFFSVKSEGGATKLVLTRSKSLRDGVFDVVRLSDYLWLVGDERAGADA